MLKEQTKKDSFDDVSAGLHDNPDFYVKEGGIAIFYQQYEIALYSLMNSLVLRTVSIGRTIPSIYSRFASKNGGRDNFSPSVS